MSIWEILSFYYQKFTNGTFIENKILSIRVKVNKSRKDKGRDNIVFLISISLSLYPHFPRSLSDSRRRLTFTGRKP